MTVILFFIDDVLQKCQRQA